MSDWFGQVGSSIRHLWRLAIVKGVIGGVLAFFVTTVISGLIEDTFPKWITGVLLPWLLKSSNVSNVILIIVPIILVLVTIIVLKLSKPDAWLDPNDNRTLRYAAAYLYYQGFVRLLMEIDSELRRSLESQKAANGLNRFIDNLFIQTLEFFGPQVRTGVIFRPQRDDSEWLTAWRANPGHYLTDKTFYIGKNPDSLKDRGCAGTVFINNEAIKYNITDPKTGEGDHPCKKVFLDYARKRGGPDYLSSTVLPIRWNTEVVGVLSIDSQQKDFFTDEDIAMIQVVADRIGDALFLHGELEQSQARAA